MNYSMTEGTSGSMRFFAALWLSKLADRLIKLVAPNRGTNFAGKLAVKLDPEFLSHFQYDPQKVLFVTGTNGKSSTTNLIVHLAKNAGFTVTSNIEGANLMTGIATALLRDAHFNGRLDADFIVMEVDERSLPLIQPRFPTGNLLVTNLQKDQMGRNGDPSFIYRKLAAQISPDMNLYLNNEEPRCHSLKRYAQAQIHFYGVARNERSFHKSPHIPRLPCPFTHQEIQFEYMNVDNVGPFFNLDRSFTSLPDDQVESRVYDVDFDGEKFSYKGLTFNMPYKVSPMLYNYASALSVAENLFGLSLEQCQDAFAKFTNIDGRFVEFVYKNKRMRYMRVKQENPDNLQNALKGIEKEQQSCSVVLYNLPFVADFNPFYHDCFFNFDSDLEPLKHSNVMQIVDTGCSFTAEESLKSGAIWLKSQGFPAEKVLCAQASDARGILDIMAQTPGDICYLICPMADYETLEPYIRKENGYAQDR